MIEEHTNKLYSHSKGDIRRVPVVDVLLAVYNGADYLHECIVSIQEQTFQDWHLVIVDDASSDNTSNILQQFALGDQRIKIVRNEVNLRLPASLNKGLRYCKSSLVARADADDVFHPERLERQFNYMEAHPEVGLLGTACNHIDSNGVVMGATSHPQQDAMIRFALPFGCTFVHPSVMMRSDLVKQVGGYDESMWTGQDYRLWADLSKITQMQNLPERLMDYRVHPLAITQSPERARQHDQLKLPIHTELLSSYLGRALSEHDAHCLVQLVAPSKLLDSDGVAHGIPLALEYLTVSRRLETAAITSAFTKQLAQGFLAQAGFQRSEHRELSRHLITTAIKVYPACSLWRRTLALSARTIVPAAIVNRLRSSPTHSSDGV